MVPQQADPQPQPGEFVVVGVDDSWHSRIALKWAIQDAARTGRVIHAVMVWNPDPLFVTPPPAFVPFEQVQTEYLAKLAKYVAEAHHEHTDVVVSHALREGDAATQLVAEAQNAAMLVLGSHGRTRVGTALLGSVGTACVRRATCPVLIIPPHMVPEESSTETGAADEEQVLHNGPQQIAGPWF